MKMLNWISNLLDSNHTSHLSIFSSEITVVNPADGLPMIGGIGGLDTLGNPYGMDGSHHEFPLGVLNDNLS
jgi:hypothetical protein